MMLNVNQYLSDYLIKGLTDGVITTSVTIVYTSQQPINVKQWQTKINFIASQ